MEKYSAFRDPGTGIQPFLTPVPPIGTEALARVLLPIGYVVGALRTLILLALVLLHVILNGLCMLLIPIPSLHSAVTRIFTAIVARLALFVVGMLWIPVAEVVTRKRTRALKIPEIWSPKAGDIIVSNWVSWIEILWLAFRYNPTFVLPVSEPIQTVPNVAASGLVNHTAGRRTGTGSAALSAPNRAPSSRTPIKGFREVSLLSALCDTGHVPTTNAEAQPLEKIRRVAKRPLVVFPECTSSNGRGLLRFANVFEGMYFPVKGFSVFVMCVRYDPPTDLTPSLSHSIPSSIFNPITHVFYVATSLPPLTMSIRLLAPSESPSSALFMASDFVSGNPGEDQLAESCAALIAQMGKMKRTAMGWEDKKTLLELYKGKK